MNAPIIRLALLSLWNRRVTAGLTIFAIALSVTLLLGVEKLRRDARTAFANTVSGTDLIVGARSGAVQLLLYSVFRVGNATNNISWESYQDISSHRMVDWAVPMALGDAHRGFRVLGTSLDYFEHYRYAGKQSLRFAEGVPFDDVFDTVLGAQVAERLGYKLGDALAVSHGTGEISFIAHENTPFTVSGILAPTGTPVDRTVHISLAGYEAMHVDWQSGAPKQGPATPVDVIRQMDLTPETVTAFMLGLKSRVAVFRLQRFINEYREEPLLAIIPGVALQELWDLMRVAEDALFAISIMVVVTGLLGMLTVILSSLEARRREMAVLRSVGARPLHVFAMFMSESAMLALIGAVAGVLMLYGGHLLIQPIAAREFGLYLPIEALQVQDWLILALVVLAATVIGTVPAVRAYRISLADGLSMRV